MKKELSDSIENVIKNEELIKILKEENKNNSGFILGKVDYFDDMHIIKMYGLTLDKKNNYNPKIFSFTLSPAPLKIEEGYNFKTGDSLYYLLELDKLIPLNGKYPSEKEINKRIKDILNNPINNIINYTKFLPFSERK